MNRKLFGCPEGGELGITGISNRVCLLLSLPGTWSTNGSASSHLTPWVRTHIPGSLLGRACLAHAWLKAFADIWLCALLHLGLQPTIMSPTLKCDMLLCSTCSQLPRAQRGERVPHQLARRREPQRDATRVRHDGQLQVCLLCGKGFSRANRYLAISINQSG
jgi:hypothetical protein